MLFLFENILTPYIYSVFCTLISLAQSSQSGQLLSYEQTRHTDRHTLAPWSEQSHAMSNHAPNCIRAHNVRHTLAPIWAASRPWATTPERHQGAQPQPLQGGRWAHPRPRLERLTPWAVRLGAQPGTLARQGVRQNISTSFALPSPHQRVTARRLPFLGWGLLKITIRSNR